MTSFYTLPSHLEGDARRLNQQHQVFRLLLSSSSPSPPQSSLLLTPAPPPAQGPILDLGTGTGIWASEYATENPSHAIHAVDLFPPSHPHPPNCHYASLDVETPSLPTWDATIPPSTYALIHTRMFLMVLRDPHAVLRRIFRALAPGGRVEFQEKQDPYRADDPSPAAQDTPLLRHSRLRIEAAKKCGLDRTVAGKIAGWMAEVGFADVRVEERRIPIGGWMDGDEAMKMAGELFKECLVWGTEGICKQVFMEGLGWDAGQVRENVKETVADLGRGEVYAAILFIRGVKP
ncbi:hypothetical protein OQA88_4854 [Cercophora sp. LCS_1]